MNVKTIIVIEFKSGDTISVNSPEDTLFLMEHIRNGFSHPSMTIGLKDIDGSWVILNAREFSYIKLYPEMSEPHE